VGINYKQDPIGSLKDSIDLHINDWGFVMEDYNWSEIPADGEERSKSNYYKPRTVGHRKRDRERQ
jgi:hypothetical protein